MLISGAKNKQNKIISNTSFFSRKNIHKPLALYGQEMAS